MGDDIEAIRAWLRDAVACPLRLLNESWYFDVRLKELFVVDIYDLWSWESPEVKRTPPYSPGYQEAIADKLDAFDRDPDRFIGIPKIGLDERRAFMQGFIEGHAAGDTRESLGNHLKMIEAEDGDLNFRRFIPAVEGAGLGTEWTVALGEFLDDHVDRVILSLGVDPSDIRVLWLEEDRPAESDGSGETAGYRTVSFTIVPPKASQPEVEEEDTQDPAEQETGSRPVMPTMLTAGIGFISALFALPVVLILYYGVRDVVVPGPVAGVLMIVFFAFISLVCFIVVFKVMKRFVRQYWSENSL